MKQNDPIKLQALEQAGILVTEALALVSPSQDVEIWEALNHAWNLIDAQVDYDQEASKYQAEN